MSKFGDRLKTLRTQRDWSQEELGEMIGVHKMTVSHWERGDRQPNIETILELCDIFNVSTEFITGQSNVTIRIVDEDGLARLDMENTSLPLYGSVCAGNGIFADDHIEEWIEVGKTYNKDEHFVLRISGDSMEPVFRDGDVVIVKKQDTSQDNDYVIAIVNGDEGVCKQLKRYENGMALVSLNPQYQPRFFSEQEITGIPVRIIGKVVESRRVFI